MRSRVPLVSLASACMVHALVFAIALRRPPRTLPPPNSEATLRAASPEEISLEMTPPTNEPRTGVSEAPTGTFARAATATEPRERAAPIEANSPEPSAAVATTASSASSPNDGWHPSLFTNDPNAKGAAPSIGNGPFVPVVPGLASATLASKPAPASSTFGIREGLAKRDADVGITRGGFVRSAVEAAIHSPDAPANGTARYDIRVLRDGTTQVTLASASERHDGFVLLAATIRKHIDPSKLHLPDGAKGLHVTIDVDVHDQYPNGQKVADVGKVSSYAGAGEYDLTKDGLVIKKMPGVSVGVTGKVCSGGIYVGPGGVGVNGGCDPVNAGVPARRIASARVQSEALL